jgi:pyruvate kinase
MSISNMPNTALAEDSLWSPAASRDLIKQLWALRKHLLLQESEGALQMSHVADKQRASARNLFHYLALRQIDLRPFQEQLASLGVSTLSRSESSVLANVDKVLGILHRLQGEAWTDRSDEEPVGMHTAERLLQSHTQNLMGESPDGRKVRIMVTLPSEAATDPAFSSKLVASGMDIARINCAHDGPDAWTAMVENVRRAAQKGGRSVRILMDLGGPKLRTGQLPLGRAVVKLRPTRDELGRVTASGYLGLRASGSLSLVAGADNHVGVKRKWLATLRAGDRIDLVDARKVRRRLVVVAVDDAGALVKCDHTAYLVPETRLVRRRSRRGPAHTPLSDLPRLETRLLLCRGDRLLVTAHAVVNAPDTIRLTDNIQHTIACTLPEVFSQVREGERIWFDDGRIGGVVCRSTTNSLEVEITQARDAGERLGSDKGINLPDSMLELAALTEKDLADLTSVASLADMVGLSFVQRAEDVATLRQHLVALGAPDVGVVLKIETRRAFENLPALLLSAMESPKAGIMIARGDLAVECGYERLAEIQEELLWAAEAAHMPVIWATQVLETLAKTGMPSRAEVTDAAMSERAECVMLNKGPHILGAIHMLDDILRRMETLQHKKLALMRPLKAWSAKAI